MRESGIQQEQFDLESAFNLYHKTLLRIATQQLKNQDIKNAATIAPDLVQEVYLELQKANKPLPQTKSDLSQLLARWTMTAAERYVRLEAKVNPKYPNPYNIRQSHLVELKQASRIAEKPLPTISEISLSELINRSKLINDKEKQILLAHYVEEKPLDQIAQELGMKDRRWVSAKEGVALKKLKRDRKLFQFLINKYE